MIQSTLFDSVASLPEATDDKLKKSDDKLVKPNQIQLPDAHLAYLPGSFDEAQAQSLFEILKQGVEWEQSEITLYGKKVSIPRLNAWYGDAHCGYNYSNTYFEPLPWLPIITQIKQLVEAAFADLLPATGNEGGYFNSALINCYRDGQDSVAWHSDDEPELGKNPIVASVSLGETRAFKLRHRYNSALPVYKMLLSAGDLLLMYGATQHHWHHEIPKTKKSVGERINITFRRVNP